MASRTNHTVRLLLSALLSTAITYIGLLLYLQPEQIPDTSAASPSWEGDNLRVMIGSGRRKQRRYTIDGYQNKRAILSSGPVILDSKAYSILHYRLTYQQGNTRATLFWWREQSAPRQFHTLEVPATQRGYLDLSAKEAWRGKVLEFGFLFNGEAGDRFQLEDVSLQQATLANRIQLATAQWMQFEPWTQRSINRIYGGSPDQLSPPTAITAVCVIISALIYTLMQIGTRQKIRYQAYAIFFLCGWVLLDVRWIANGMQQAQATTATYAGLAQKDKMLKAPDANFYRFIQRIKAEHLPQDPAFIQVLRDAPANEYFRLRARYHLAPHNVYNYARLPSQASAEKTDYILVLGKVHGLRYDTAAQELQWGNNRLNGRLVANRGDASLYALNPSPPP